MQCIETGFYIGLKIGGGGGGGAIVDNVAVGGGYRRGCAPSCAKCEN